MPGEPLYFDALEVGHEWVTEGRLVTDADIAAFADLTGDRNPIHLDQDFARSTPFRRCIAHGLLGLSLTGGLTALSVPARACGKQTFRMWVNCLGSSPLAGATRREEARKTEQRTEAGVPIPARAGVGSKRSCPPAVTL